MDRIGWRVKEAEFAADLKNRIARAPGAQVEIRISEENLRENAGRLKRALQLAGVKARVAEVEASPRSEVSIETGVDGAKLGLAIQSALIECGIRADFVVHTRVAAKWVIVHFGRS